MEKYSPTTENCPKIPSLILPEVKPEINTVIDLRGDQGGDFPKILPDFRRGDQGRDRLHMTQCLNMT